MSSTDEYMREGLIRLRDEIEKQPALLKYIDVAAFNEMAEKVGSPIRLVDPDEEYNP